MVIQITIEIKSFVPCAIVDIFRKIWTKSFHHIFSSLAHKCRQIQIIKLNLQSILYNIPLTTIFLLLFDILFNSFFKLVWPSIVLLIFIAIWIPSFATHHNPSNNQLLPNITFQCFLPISWHGQFHGLVITYPYVRMLVVVNSCIFCPIFKILLSVCSF